jgi:hypothetical protein
MTKDEIKTILDAHALWLIRNPNGSRANLSHAYLSGAYLAGASYDKETRFPHFQIVPQSGPFWLWKKLRANRVALLEVPPEAGRVSSTGRRCRVEFAKVLSIESDDGTACESGESGYDRGATAYHVGEIVRPDKWDDDFRTEFSHGIHGHLTRAEAQEHIL